MKATKEFRGVPNGEIYPVTYNPGYEIPAELSEAAVEAKCAEPEKPPQQNPAPVQQNPGRR